MRRLLPLFLLFFWAGAAWGQPVASVVLTPAQAQALDRETAVVPSTEAFTISIRMADLKNVP